MHSNIRSRCLDSFHYLGWVLHLLRAPDAHGPPAEAAQYCWSYDHGHYIHCHINCLLASLDIEHPALGID
jgi:hypothetical protein